MKTSNKIILILALLMFAALFASNVVLKRQFDAIDKSDSFWMYQAREEGTFSHVHIKGGNLLRTKIISGGKNMVLRKENLRNWLVASIKSDTLFIDYSTKVRTTREKASDMLTNHTVYVMVKTLKSVIAEKANIEIECRTNDSLKIQARNSSNIDLQEISSDADLSVVVDKNSFFGIYRQDEAALDFHSLEAVALDKSKVVLKNVKSQQSQIILSQNSTIDAEGQLLKNLQLK